MSKMKYAVSSYSFQQLIGKGMLNQLSCIMQASNMGFDAIEFTEIEPHDGSGRQEYACRIRNEAEKHGLAISNYAVAAEFLHGGPDKISEEIQRVKEEIDLAAILGTPRMRHDATWGFPPGSPLYRSFQSIVGILADACREITEYAQSKGILTMVENHGYYCQDSDRVEALYNAVNHPNFRLLVDMGNFLCADEDPLLAVARIAPYAGYVHAKDFYIRSYDQPDPGRGFFRSRAGYYLKGTIVGHGQVPVRQCLALLKKSGYSGTLSIEFEGMEPCLDAIEIGLSNLKAYWQSIH